MPERYDTCTIQRAGRRQDMHSLHPSRREAWGTPPTHATRDAIRIRPTRLARPIKEPSPNATPTQGAGRLGASQACGRHAHLVLPQHVHKGDCKRDERRDEPDGEVHHNLAQPAKKHHVQSSSRDPPTPKITSHHAMRRSPCHPGMPSRSARAPRRRRIGSRYRRPSHRTGAPAPRTASERGGSSTAA